MPVRVPQPPPHVRRRLRRDAAVRRLLRQPPPGPPAPPLPVHAAGLADVRSELSLAEVAPAPASWRYVSSGDRAVEVGALERRAAVGEDRFSSAIGAALAAARRDARAAAGDFEARLLRVSAVRLFAVWLHATDAEDLLVPLEGASAGLESGRVYAAGEFGRALARAAERVEHLYAEAERPDELGS
jgi:hypothetical protein